MTTRKLTLTPHRNALIGLFEENTYAYLHADRPVRKDGVLITPTPVVKTSDEGEICFDVLPNQEVDNGESFYYVVAVFAPDGRSIFRENISMPDLDSSIWDLVPEEIDLDQDESFTPLSTIIQSALNPNIPSYHRGAPPPQDFETLKSLMESRSSYNLQLQISSPYSTFNIRYYPEDFDFPNLNSYEDLANQLNLVMGSKTNDALVSYYWNGREFIFKPDINIVENVKVHDHRTEFGGTLTKFDNSLGFTQGSFGALANGSILRSSQSVSQNSIIGASGLMYKFDALTGTIDYVVNGEVQSHSLTIEQDDTGETVIAKLETLIPNSTWYFDGTAISVSLEGLEKFNTTTISSALKIGSEDGAKFIGI